MERPESFEEFWPFYVSQHRNKTCRQLPVVGYGFAWIGHFAFEKNKPASWGGVKAFAWSLRGDLKMWRMIAMGQMDAEVERVDQSGMFEMPADAAVAH